MGSTDGAGNGGAAARGLVWLDGGRVTLHDARRDRVWSVELAPFGVSSVQVTRARYRHVREHAGHDNGASTPTLDERVVHDDDVPVVDVTWREAVAWCNDASRLEGLEPAYEEEPDGAVLWRPERGGYRLPTEAEWEFACRAGTTGPHYGELREIAWTSADDVDGPQPVAGKRANGFGMFDLLGNVWEWCWNPLDTARYGDYRVFRGGGFADASWSVRASVRRGGAPGMNHEDLGFRVVRGAVEADAGGAFQGWSAADDEVSARAAMRGSLPSGWTPKSHASR